MIVAKHIYKSFDKTEVLKDVNLTIPDSSITAIVGPSGAGKSTLLHILGTLLKPDSGQVLYNNIDLCGLGNTKLANFRNQNIGFVFQSYCLLPEFSALENIALPAIIGGIKKTAAQKRAMELLDFVGLTARASHFPAQLSGGERQRVAIARALINNPQIILADEPTGNLDSATRSQIIDLLTTTHANFSTTIVLVTHDSTLSAIADNKIVISDGKIL